jgi:hypothetical protein
VTSSNVPARLTDPAPLTVAVPLVVIVARMIDTPAGGGCCTVRDSTPLSPLEPVNVPAYRVVVAGRSLSLLSLHPASETSSARIVRHSGTALRALSIDSPDPFKGVQAFVALRV